MDGWVALLRSIRDNLSVRRYELATLAAAQALRSSYCSLAHGSVLADKVFSPVAVTDIITGNADAPLDAGERAMMAFVEKVVRNAHEITRGDIDDLRSHGYGDEEIFDVTAAAAARCFFSKLLDALGAEPDVELPRPRADAQGGFDRGTSNCRSAHVTAPASQHGAIPVRNRPPDKRLRATANAERAKVVSTSSTAPPWARRGGQLSVELARRESEIGYGLSWARTSPPLLASLWTFT